MNKSVKVLASTVAGCAAVMLSVAPVYASADPGTTVTSAQANGLAKANTALAKSGKQLVSDYRYITVDGQTIAIDPPQLMY